MNRVSQHIVRPLYQCKENRMNCLNCGSRLSNTDQEYCPHCGFNVRLQRKIEYISKYYYNQGLEKASIRDLSGAIECLKQSLAYNKNNIEARNLLGLVFFETGEVVAALSEWVISKNLQPNRNLASDYISRLQANPGKLAAINETIKKYNHALILCRQGHEDMAGVQLRKLLSQNSKLIKGYHLLALIQMRSKEWNKARRTLKKAARIDKTNTTTLRFLKEVDEQTGVATRLEGTSHRGLFAAGNKSGEDRSQAQREIQVQQAVYRGRSRISLFFTFIIGILAGIAAIWFLGIPAIRQGIYREANDQIIRYSESLASQSTELSRAQGQAQESDSTAEAAVLQSEEDRRTSESLEALAVSYEYLMSGDADSSAVEIQKVYKKDLPETVIKIYDTIVKRTGVRGIEDPSEAASEEDDYEEGSGDTGYDSYYDSYYDNSYYGDSY